MTDDNVVADSPVCPHTQPFRGDRVSMCLRLVHGFVTGRSQQHVRVNSFSQHPSEIGGFAAGSANHCPAKVFEVEAAVSVGSSEESNSYIRQGGVRRKYGLTVYM